MALERRKITVPADGVTQKFSLAGIAVVVEQVGSFSGPEQVPLIRFQDQQNIAQPIYPQSVLIAVNGLEFRRFFITGTSESAGSILYLLVSDVCMDQSLSPETFRNRRAVAGTSFVVASTDAVQQLSLLSLTNADNELPTKIYISCSDAALKYAFNANPVQGAGGLGTYLIADSDPVAIEGINFITSFRFISAAATTPTDLTVHLEY